MHSSGWASAGLLREAVSRLHHGWEGLPRAARRRWWATLASGGAATLAVTVALVTGARALDRSGALAWEPGAVGWIATDLPLSFSMGLWLEGPGNGFVLWAVVLYAAGVAAWMGRPLRSIALLLGYTLVYLPVLLGWWMWDRLRPRIILQGMASPGGFLHSFPSGHVAQSVFAYGLLVWFWTRASRSPWERLLAAAVFLVLVAAVALGRLRTGAHWPSDVAGGAAMATSWLAAVVAALGRAERAAPPAHSGTRRARTPGKA